MTFQYVAYADDVTALLCTRTQRLRWKYWIAIYERISNAKVNHQKITVVPLVPTATDFTDIAGKHLTRESTWLVGGVPHTIMGDIQFSGIWDKRLEAIAATAAVHK